MAQHSSPKKLSLLSGLNISSSFFLSLIISLLSLWTPWWIKGETFKEILCKDKKSDPLSPGVSPTNNSGDPCKFASPEEGSSGNLSKSKSKACKGKGKTTGTLDMVDYLSKLAKSRTDFQKSKQCCLMGYVFGTPLEFAKVKSKLLNEWKNIKGEVSIFPKNNFWFEISFTNPIDKKKVWDNRPYHIAGQLIILRMWKPNFNTFTESTTNVDLWVRIPFLPTEFMNKDAVKIIIENTGVGEFIRLDPYSAKGMNANYARICVNVETGSKMVNLVPIPDENDVVKLYPIWFEDLSKGCGYCASRNHVYEECPHRSAPPKQVQITFSNNRVPGDFPSSSGVCKSKGDKSTHDWNVAGKQKKKGLAPGESNASGFRPYLLGNGGVSIVFNDLSSQSSKETSPKSTEIVLEATADYHPTPLVEKVNIGVPVPNAPTTLDAGNQSLPNVVNEPLDLTFTNNIPIVTSSAETQPILSSGLVPMPMLAHFLEANPKTVEVLDDISEFMEGDSLIEAINSDYKSDDDFVKLMLNDEPLPDLFEPALSDNSFHSFQTDHSVNKLMGNISVIPIEATKSDSSKRINQDVLVDTATSESIKSKKPRV